MIPKFVLLICVVIITQSYELSDKNNDELAENSNACTTEGCLSAASVIRDYMDESYDPCDNFYSFTCGGFIKRNPYSEHEINKLGTVSPFTKIKKRVEQQIKTLLEEKYDKESEPRTFFLVKRFYKTCVNKKFNTEGAQPLKNIIRKLGGWPVVEGKKWNRTNFDWMDMDIKLRSMGYEPRSIFHVFVSSDQYNRTRNVLYINPLTSFIATTTIEENKLNDKIDEYKNFMLKVAEYLSANKKRADREMEKVKDFEIKIAKASINNKEENDTFISIADLEEQFPTIPWKKYIDGLTGPVTSINRTDRIIKLKNSNYTSELLKIIADTPQRTIANYMIWRTILVTAPYVGGKIQNFYKNFKEERLLDRWEECIKLLNDKKTGLGVGVSSLYVRKYFNNQTRGNIEPVLNSIIREFQETLKKSTWMDESTKNAAIRKSAFMKKIIAYPDELLNDAVIDNYTQSLRFSEFSFLRNALSLHRFHYDHALSGLLNQSDQSLWTAFPDLTSPNAVYNRFKNAFAILAGILQSPIFNLDWPNYAKFGSIGFIIGHEMMHAFDSKNIEFDESGSLRPWFTPQVTEEYQRKVKCFVDQYGSYKDEELEMSVDGNLTLNENLADNVGLKVSFNAYKNWETRHPNELPLPGLNYTPEQIFWITSIHFLCSINSLEYRYNILNNDPHTLSDFRARGSLSNSEDFAKAFSCPNNSTMNPELKCKLW